MHFLMPHVFASHREFNHWFSNPLKSMIEGNQEYNEQLIKRKRFCKCVAYVAFKCCLSVAMYSAKLHLPNAENLDTFLAKKTAFMYFLH